MKQKTYLFIFVGIILAASLISIACPVFVHAVQQPLEITYPELPLVQTPTTVRTALPDYVKYIFTLAMVISGLIVFGVFLAAGLRYLTSAGNPGAVNESKSRMISAFLGAIIILASYLILNTINPQISLIQINDMNPAGGVKFTDADGTTFITSASVPNLELVGIPTPSTVTFLSPEVEVTPCYNINDFTEASCPSSGKIITSGSFPSAAKAAKLFWAVLGVYAYDDAFWKGDLRIYGVGQYATLGDFNEKIGSIYMRNTAASPDERDEPDYILYGAILHAEEGFKGDCKFVDISTNDLGNWKDKANSLTIFKRSKGYLFKGGGVNFYTDVNYQNSMGGFFTNQNTSWSNFSSWTTKEIYSLKIQGNYLVALAENSKGEAENGNTGKCEIFFTSDSNLNDNYIGQCTELLECNETTGCWGIGDFCPVCTVSCAKSYIVIPIIR